VGRTGITQGVLAYFHELLGADRRAVDGGQPIEDRDEARPGQRRERLLADLAHHQHHRDRDGLDAERVDIAKVGLRVWRRRRRHHLEARPRVGDQPDHALLVGRVHQLHLRDQQRLRLPETRLGRMVPREDHRRGPQQGRRPGAPPLGHHPAVRHEDHHAGDAPIEGGEAVAHRRDPPAIEQQEHVVAGLDRGAGRRQAPVAEPALEDLAALQLVDGAELRVEDPVAHVEGHRIVDDPELEPVERGRDLFGVLPGHHVARQKAHLGHADRLPVEPTPGRGSVPTSGGCMSKKHVVTAGAAVLGFLGSIVAAPARAGDVETWAGGLAITGVQEVQGEGFGTILSQVEFDFRAASGPVFFRLDLDYHFDPYFFGVEGQDYQLAPHYPLPPEYGLVQLGTKYHLRAGVTNPDMGMQEWDENLNYFASYSSAWALSNGQNLGLEPGITFDDGTNLFVFGGYDMGWLTPAFGGGFQTEQDLWGTWSGVAVFPHYVFDDAGDATPYVFAVTADELYPADAVWLSLELDLGVANGGTAGGGQFMASLFPDGMVGGAIRIDKQFQDDAFNEAIATMDDFAVSAVLLADPIEALDFKLEGKESWPHGGGDPYFTGTFLVAAKVPGEASDDYAVHDPPEEAP
jgi:hypothetical protein